MDNEATRWLSKLFHHYVDKLGVRERRRRLGGHVSQKFLLELNFASGRVNEENLSWPLEKALLAHLCSPILTVTYLLTGQIRGDANGAPC